MNDRPLVSIIIPTYNREKLISKAIDSVLNQTYDKWELIVVDDKSTDNTKKIVMDYSKKDDRIKYLLNNGKKGPAAARNLGINNCNGNFIAFLDSDDEWFNNHIEESIYFLEKEDVNVCFSLWIEKDLNGNQHKYLSSSEDLVRINNAKKAMNLDITNERIIFPAPDFFEYTNIYDLYCFHTNTMVVKKDVVKKVGMFNESLLASEDYEYAMRIFHEHSFCLIRNYHFIYNQGQDNIHNFIDRRALEIEQLFNKNIANKITFCGIYKCEMIKSIKKLVKNSTKILNKDRFIQFSNEKLAMKYYTLAVLNKNQNSLKSIIFLIKSMYYKYSSRKIKCLLHFIFPFMFKDLKFTKDELWLY
ncbi:glycosyl transferase family 2 [Clostridium cellulovorans 743B]|uniref:Glycosyl transferase family 2 n=2 Tax=Clostridium cellulovorans TaxID=1493 RepID=D9STW4_CLOC7|nr:glycosyl transferase family 2 [Clostridium cellulovorans 743B]